MCQRQRWYYLYRFCSRWNAWRALFKCLYLRLPSDLEGMPLSLLEAMSYSNCCLTSDIAECTEVCEENAVYFKKSDKEDLENKLRFLLENENIVKEYKEKAQDYICKKYNWDDITEKTLSLYKK